ncbi:MAG: PilZ domain-containing protein [Deltaproteobacteria bacterium]|nr:PilZ domain-containing protein [Deltaproteobacteria bacterium]
MGGREHRRTLRISLQKPLQVIIGSIGSDVRYDLETRDISTRGFFLEFEKPGRFPFTSSSIMEIWLELSPGDSIFFNGKMARVVLPAEAESQGTNPGIAVRIVQIEPEEEKRLADFVQAQEDEAIKAEEEEEKKGKKTPPAPPKSNAVA